MDVCVRIIHFVIRIKQRTPHIHQLVILIDIQ